MNPIPSVDRARMPFFRLLGAIGTGRFIERSARLSVLDTDRVVWSHSPGSLAIEAWITGLLAAFTGWDLLVVAMQGLEVPTLIACVLAVPMTFVGFHILALVVSGTVSLLLGDPIDPMKWVHRFSMAVITGAAIVAAPVCAGVWPWLGWMALNLFAWAVLEIRGLFESIAAHEIE